MKQEKLIQLADELGQLTDKMNRHIATIYDLAKELENLWDSKNIKSIYCTNQDGMCEPGEKCNCK